jgi:probable HAF family extracellular repeat protein
MGPSASFTGLRAGVRAALIAMLALSAAGPASAAVEYDFILVDAFQPDYDLKESLLLDLNNQGLGCGIATDLPTYSGYFWSAAAGKTRLPFTLARGINDVGQVAGLNMVYDVPTGSVVTIPHVPGAVASPVALDINDSGVVVGYAETCFCSNSDRTLQLPFIWDPVGGSRSIPVEGAKELVKINNNNVAVGIIRGGSPDGFVYEIATGRTIRLAAFLPGNPYPRTEASDVNDLGMVTGRHRAFDALSFDGFVWTEAAGATLLPRLHDNAAMDVHPLALNDAGVVVGMAEISNHVWHAFMWDSERGIRDLNDLAALPPEFILDRAFAINDKGWIGGDGHLGPYWSSSQAFVLVPRTRALVGVEPWSANGFDLHVRPNPSPGPATIEFVMETAGTARIGIFDLAGRKVAEMVEAGRSAGTHSTSWDGRDASGRLVPAGAYVVRLESAGRTVTRRVAVVR